MKTKNSISFLLNGEAVHIDFALQNIKPSTTVLNWLRNYAHHTETKEGCAEGDCGACTVVVAQPDKSSQKLIYKAVNSCLLFLPSIDGKLLITSRGLAPETDNVNILHPVQKAIVDEHASQCGFCTPGFVMSLFALYHKSIDADDNEINNALAGNLCRCTGYDSIRKAAKVALNDRNPDRFDQLEHDLLKSLDALQQNTMFDADCQNQRYLKPATINEALAARAAWPEALVVNGSTDAALQQSKHFKHIPFILDISGINEFKNFNKNGFQIEAGAGLSLEDLRLEIVDAFPALNDILSVFASRQIRNAATLGGNLGSASPIGDTTPLLLACNASVKLISISGSRTMPLSEFITGYRQTALQKDEFIETVFIPLPAADEKVKMYKVSKRHDMDISTVSAAFRLKINLENKVENFAAFYGGMAATTIEANETKSFLLAKQWSQTTIEEAMSILIGEFNPISDARSGAEFRNIAAANLLQQFFNDTQSEMS